MLAFTPVRDGMIQTIAPDDDMYDPRHHVQYFQAGESAIRCIDVALHAAERQRADIQTVLDLPCGHGRALRYLLAAFPHAELVASDLNRSGVNFCAQTFGATPVYSHDDPAQIPIRPGTVDLIWVSSLLTHLDAPRWRGFLELFQRVLRPGGIVVFTTHGRVSYNRMMEGTIGHWDLYWRETLARRAFERTGFGYAAYSRSKTYGASLSDPAWVLRQVAAIPELRLVYFGEGAWAWQHDVFAYVRDPDWQVHRHPRVTRWQWLKHWVRDRLPLNPSHQ
jgi:SAM-dependent methyltransferase